jgi:hypothetical protein
MKVNRKRENRVFCVGVYDKNLKLNQASVNSCKFIIVWVSHFTIMQLVITEKNDDLINLQKNRSQQGRRTYFFSICLKYFKRISNFVVYSYRLGRFFLHVLRTFAFL